MNTKTVIFIIGILVLAGVSYCLGNITGGEKVRLKMEEVLQIEKGKTQRIDSLLKSKALSFQVTTSGIVKEIVDRTLTLSTLNENGEEAFSFSVPIASDAQIITDVLLPGDAPKEKIKQTLTLPDGKTVRLGEEEIEFEKIKIGDNAFVILRVNPDYNIEGILVRISPAELLK